jgi:YD repeat-containing protein
MTEKWIRNREGKIIGRMDGNLLRDGTGRITAKFDADGFTRDRSGRIVGKSDLRFLQLGKDQRAK